MIWIAIILFIISIIVFCCAIHKSKHTNKINNEVNDINKALEYQHQELEKKIIGLNDLYSHKQQSLINAQIQVANEEQRLKDIIEQTNSYEEKVSSLLNNQKELSQKAFENYFDLLEQKYKEEVQEYSQLTEVMKTSYSNLQEKYMREADECREELDSIRATRAAAIEAQKKEQEIKEQLEFYCLCPKTTDIDDIKVLERIKPQLHAPRILSMLIWSTYFQKPMTALCNNVLGTSTVCGIYKITNQENGKCYIGQSVDIATRWKNHAKCGLGIDTPAGNKLYKEMQEYGIWSFSWELLETCERAKLDEKEKFYIELYESKDYGYNSQNGNNRSS